MTRRRSALCNLTLHRCEQSGCAFVFFFFFFFCFFAMYITSLLTTHCAGDKIKAPTVTVIWKLKAITATSTNNTNRGHFPAIIPFYLAHISSAGLCLGCRAHSAVSSVLRVDAHRLSSASISITNERPFTCGATAHCSFILMNRQDTNTLSLKFHPSPPPHTHTPQPALARL